MADAPNPGTRAAIERGCLCAVIDNNHGQWPPWGLDGWWITEGCPVHVPEAGPDPALPVAAELDPPELDGQPPLPGVA